MRSNAGCGAERLAQLALVGAARLVRPQLAGDPAHVGQRRPAAGRATHRAPSRSSTARRPGGTQRSSPNHSVRRDQSTAIVGEALVGARGVEPPARAIWPPARRRGEPLGGRRGRVLEDAAVSVTVGSPGRCQRRGAISSSMASGPPRAGLVGRTGGGFSSTGADTSHSRSIPSAVVNSVWSPIMTSWIRRS